MPSTHRKATADAGIAGSRLQRSQAGLATMQARQHRRVDAVRQLIESRAEVVPSCDDHFGGCRWRRRAQIGDEIGNRDISFMSDRGNRRYWTARDRTRRDLLVECPQIFNRAATTPDDYYIDPGNLADRGHCAGYVDRRTFALHSRGTNDDVHVRIAPPQYLNDVANRCAFERRDD